MLDINMIEREKESFFFDIRTTKELYHKVIILEYLRLKYKFIQMYIIILRASMDKFEIFLSLKIYPALIFAIGVGSNSRI